MHDGAVAWSSLSIKVLEIFDLKLWRFWRYPEVLMRDGRHLLTPCRELRCRY